MNIVCGSEGARVNFIKKPKYIRIVGNYYRVFFRNKICKILQYLFTLLTFFLVRVLTVLVSD